MYALADCNNFYVSCERVFNSSLEGKPVIVLSNNDGCAIARSNEAKKLGIKMGANFFEIEDLIKQHDVRVYSTNFVLYADMSLRVKRLLSRYCANIEDYSIDEVFLDFHGYKYHDLNKHCLEIINVCKQGTGIPLSIGIAPTKTLAKIGNKFAKKYKGYKSVCLIDSDEKIKKSLELTEISDVWGIGSRHSKRLNAMGVNNAYEFTQLPQSWVRKHMTVVGERTWKELQGIPCIDMELVPSPKKNIMVSRSFGKMITDFETISEAVSTYSAMAAAKLRGQHSCAKSLFVFLDTNPFREDLPQYFRNMVIKLPVPTSSDLEIISFAKQGLLKLYKPGFHYKKAGVMLMDIVPENPLQTNMFDKVDRPKHNKLMEVKDMLNTRYGRHTVRSAAQGYAQDWKIRQEKLSPCYTTRISDFPLVN